MGTFNAHEVFPCSFFLLVKIVFPKKRWGRGKNVFHLLFCALTPWKVVTAAIISPQSAQRAFKAMSACGGKAARCRPHNSRKFIWLTVRAGFQHGKASIRVSHTEESAPCFNSAHTPTLTAPLLWVISYVLYCSDSLCALPDSQETPVP